MNKKGLSLIEIIVIVLIVGVLAAILLPAISRARRSKRITGCIENLKQLALAMHLYASENKDWLPPIDDTRNNFIFNANLLYPEYLSDHMIAMCPADPQYDPDTNFRLIADHPVDGTRKGEVHADCFTDSSYIYLGWMVMSDKEMEAFFEAYDKIATADYDKNITVPDGWGHSGGDTIHRLSLGLDRFLKEEIEINFSGPLGASTVPIAWDRPFGDTTKFSHQPSAVNVLYLNGSVDWYYPARGLPQMTETMARLLDERPREPIPYCE